MGTELQTGMARDGLTGRQSPPSQVEIPASDWSRDLVKAIAADIGADTVAYIEVMYPKSIAATSSSFKTSVRNHIYNQIMAAIEVKDAGQVVARLADRRSFRRWWVGVYRKVRRNARD